MKKSHYNIIVPLEDEYVLYNTLRGTLTIIDEEIYTVLTTGEGPQHIIDMLHRQGALLKNENKNETDMLQTHLKKKKTQPLKTGYRGSDIGTVEFLNFIITHECNLDCTYCYKKTDPCSGHMEQSVAEKGIAFAQKEIEKNSPDTLFVSFYGGEPVLNKEVMFYTADALEKICTTQGVTCMIKIFTPGTLLDKKFLDTLSQYTVADIHITVDGPESVHNAQRVYPDTTSSFDDILKGAELAESMGFNVILRVNISKKHPDIIPFLKKLKTRIKTAHIYLGTTEPRMDYCTHYYSSYGFPGKSDLFTNIISTAASHGIEILPFGAGIHFSLCASTTPYFHIIDVDGRVYKCMSLVGRTRHAVGTVRADGTLNKTPVYTEWLTRDPLNIPQCSQCILFPVCRGGCSAIAWREYNTDTYNEPGCFTIDIKKQILSAPPVQKYLKTKNKKNKKNIH